MLRRFLTASALLLTATAAQAAPVFLGNDTWMVEDDRGTAYGITVQFQDREGDYAVRLCSENGKCDFRWVRCSNDTIATRYSDGSVSEWRYVDHRKIEGWMSDAACGRMLR